MFEIKSMSIPHALLGFTSLCVVFLLATPISEGRAQNSQLPQRNRVLNEAFDLLDLGLVSYAYGGRKIGDPSECQKCSDCLARRKAKPKEQLQTCPVCENCSLDCSHFIHRVFRKAGLKTRYLTTQMMRTLDADTLLDSYNLIEIGIRSARALPGDLIVYDGHVVMVYGKSASDIGDVIHATSGRSIRGPGNGIQLARRVTLEGFRGNIKRILRHKNLAEELASMAKRRKGVSRITRGQDKVR